MELAKLIELRVVSLCHDALRVINCCLAGTATHKLFNLLESVFGPDMHLGPSYTGTAVSGEEDDLADEGDEDLPTEGTTEPLQFPEAESREYQELQKAIRALRQQLKPDKIFPVLLFPKLYLLLANPHKPIPH